jgi:uncharacterized protein YlaI
MLPSCSICSTTADDWMTDGWTVTKDDTKDAPATTYICAECARKHIRSIEGKLADEDWAW